MGSKVKSDFLVASPSFASGAARLLDFYGQFDEYNISETEAEADAKALAADWQMVGEDLRSAMADFEARNTA